MCIVYPFDLSFKKIKKLTFHLSTRIMINIHTHLAIKSIQHLKTINDNVVVYFLINPKDLPYPWSCLVHWFC